MFIKPQGSSRCTKSLYLITIYDRKLGKPLIFRAFCMVEISGIEPLTF